MKASNFNTFACGSMNIYVGFTLTHSHSVSVIAYSLTHTHTKTKHLELCSGYGASSSVAFSRVDVDGDVYIYLYLYLYAVYSITYQHFDRVNRSLGLGPASLCARYNIASDGGDF